MKKKIIHSILIFLIFLWLFNYKYFLWNYYNYLWNTYYGNSKYFTALKYHNKSYKYTKNDNILYNIWNDYYKIWDYENSLEQYKKMSKSDSLEFDKLHNLWNLFYRLGEKYINNSINFWTDSLNSYKEALLIKNEEKTRKNYEFVLDKLNNLLKEEETKETEEEKKEENLEKEKSEEEQEQWDNEWQENNNSNNEQRDEKYKLDWKTESIELTWKQREELKQYEKYLKAIEANNQIFFNKKGENNNSELEKLRNDFAWDPFFDSVFDDWWEKDW